MASVALFRFAFYSSILTRFPFFLLCVRFSYVHLTHAGLTLLLRAMRTKVTTSIECRFVALKEAMLALFRHRSKTIRFAALLPTIRVIHSVTYY